MNLYDFSLSWRENYDEQKFLVIKANFEWIKLVYYTIYKLQVIKMIGFDDDNNWIERKCIDRSIHVWPIMYWSAFGLRTLIPCIRDMARSGLSALSVRIVLKAWIPPAPTSEATKLMRDT